MTIELTERDLYLIINALVYHSASVGSEYKGLRIELDDIIQDLQFQRGCL